MRQKLTILAALIVLPTMMMGAAHAACEWRHRIPHNETECLSAKWKNYHPFSSSHMPRNWVTARSSCSDLGKVVAKVDLAKEFDRTWHLVNNKVRRHNTSAKIRGVYCCRDLGVCHRPR